MDLHQIQLTYLTEEDRILLRASFKIEGGAIREIRGLLTRRLVKNLWPAIVRGLETQVRLDQPQAAHASAEIIGMEHQGSISAIRAAGNFDAPFETSTQAYPTGEVPILVSTVQFTLDTKRPMRLNFRPVQGDGFELGLTPNVLHAFCTLLQEAVKTANWDIDCFLPGTAIRDYGSGMMN